MSCVALFCRGLSHDLPVWRAQGLPIYHHQRLFPLSWVRIRRGVKASDLPRISEVTYTFVQLFAVRSHPTMVRLASNP